MTHPPLQSHQLEEEDDDLQDGAENQQEHAQVVLSAVETDSGSDDDNYEDTDDDYYGSEDSDYDGYDDGDEGSDTGF